MGKFLGTFLIFFFSWNVWAAGSVNGRYIDIPIDDALESVFAPVSDFNYGNTAKNDTVHNEPSLPTKESYGTNAAYNQESPQQSDTTNNSPIQITISCTPAGDDDDKDKQVEVYHTPEQNAELPAQAADNTQPQQENPGATIILKPTTNTDSTSTQNQVATPVADNSNQQQPESNSTENVQPTQNSELGLKQVTVSQILYHMNLQYEKMYSKQGNNEETYEGLQMFLSKMLSVSTTKATTVEGNKNIASTTYAAYYSTEYAYTFALCKLHHITGGPKDSNLKIDPQVSSQCSQIVEKFTKFSVLYENVITETLANNGGQVLQYENGDGNKTDDTTSANSDSNADAPDEKVSTAHNEIKQKSNLEKDLHGYNDTDFYSRLRSEGQELDQYDNKLNREIGNSKYSEETKSRKTDTAAYMLSEKRGLKNQSSTSDTTNDKILRKSSNHLEKTDESSTKGHMENDQMEVDTNKWSKYSRSDRKLNEDARNYLEDDEVDIGGNIPNAKIQEVTAYQNTTVERIQDQNEKITKYKDPNSKPQKYIFREAVSTLVLYIRTVHAFVSNMETNVKNTSDQGKDVYTEMYSSVYEQTVIYRRYLRKYFTNVNVENGSFNNNTDVETKDMEIDTLQTTIQRFLFLKNTKVQQVQEQPNEKSKSDISSNPLTLLWYFEEASYYEYLQKTQTNVSFMGYLPYPDFSVKTDSNNQKGADVQFCLV